MNESEEHKPDGAEIAPVTGEVADQPVLDQVQENKASDRPVNSARRVFRNIGRVILQIILILAVIAGCGAVLYFGAPLVYNQYVRPVEENTSQLSDLGFRQSQSEIQIADLQARLATLEAGQTPQADSLTDLDSRVQGLEGADTQRNESLVELTYQADLLRAMELLSRARLFLYQSNFGLARTDIRAARDVLAEIQATAPESKQADLTEALFRLDLALKNLPDFPVAASDDLDIAWQVLMDGYPAPPTSTPTPIPTAFPTDTPTPSLDVTAAPTAIP